MKLVFVLLVACTLDAAGEALAFPGAEGFGAHTSGGRGGKVLIVGNLNDAGPGSLRAACEAKGPRTIVFRVAGIITLQSPIHITEPYLTIAGQSAPGDGICIRGNEFTVNSHDIILRFLRVRPGDIAAGEADGIAIGGDSRNIIVDHCSASWSIDEALSPSGALADITVQWCLIAEALDRSIHQKGSHGYGSLARASGGVTFHHNLWAHNVARNPRFGDNYGRPPFPTFDFRNNVIYDYGDMASGMTGDRLSANYVANYIRPGPSSNLKRGMIVLTGEADAQFYLAGNVVEGGLRLIDRPEINGRRVVTVVDQPFAAPPLQTTTAEAAFPIVLENAGATHPARDAVDRRIIHEVRTRTGHIIDSQWEVGGWPDYRMARPPVDTDRNGLPDEWERAHPPTADAGDYTRLEQYLNDLAAAGRKP
ncbi:MAG: pectate lyase [Acidobacteria bacterium]|nr:pectate lyase [Acidobacteriota bacterium]